MIGAPCLQDALTLFSWIKKSARLVTKMPSLPWLFRCEPAQDVENGLWAALLIMFLGLLQKFMVPLPAQTPAVSLY